MSTPAILVFMKMNTLGNTDIVLPEICLGTMTWGQKNTEEEAHQQLDYAVKERGTTFIDTAEIYPIPPTPEKQGLTETYLGNWIAKTGNREKLFIATKIAPASLISTRPTGTHAKLDRASIREAVMGSLERLQTDYIDLYQIHWPERKTNFFNIRGYSEDMRGDSTSIEETLEALKELIDEGLIKHIGVSNETPWGVSEYLRLSREKGLPRIVSIQNQYSLLNRTFEVGLAEICIEENISLLAYSVLNMGVLTGKYLEGAQPAGARFTVSGRNSERYNPEIAQPAIREYIKVAHKHGLNPAQMAIAFANSRDFTTSSIIGATNLEQLETCIDAHKIELSQEVLNDLHEVYTKFPDPCC